MKLTADLILHSSQYLNALNEFHIDLRGKVNITVGYKIPYIENLAATNDQFSCIDLTDNEITSLSELPPLKRIRSLLLSNNRITRVDPTYGKCTPYLENLILTNNKVLHSFRSTHLLKLKT